MRARNTFAFLMCSLVLSFLFGGTTSISETTESKTLGSSSPVIQDFYVNNTCAGNISQFAFNLTDTVVLQESTFTCNATSPPSFTNQSVNLSGTQTWANFTVIMPNYNCTVTFNFWVNDTSGLWTTTGDRTIRVYTTGVSPYFNYLGQAITTVENANTWSQVDPYYAYILQNNLTSLQTTIDNCAAAHDWQDVLLYSAECNKLWPNNIPGDVKTDINYALGNYTMIGSNSLPSESGYFTVYDRYSFYGYYYANQSWALSYNSSITSKWNVTSAYSFFDTAVNYSVSNGLGPSFIKGLPLSIYTNDTAKTGTNRFYDEDAETISCYILFAELLNVSDALNKATYWWNYLVSTHWITSPGFFDYTPYPGIGSGNYECEAPFFLKIISLLKYYYPTLPNWNAVLTDISNRFLSKEWNSAQWLNYVVVHATSYSQLRLENTLGAWQALMGVYTQLNSTYQSNMIDMLQGTNALPPAWTLMLLQAPSINGLYNTTSHLFSEYYTPGASFGTASGDNANITAQAEILMFMQGVIPGTTSLVFPFEELNYEYTQDLDPALMTFNSTTRNITIPVVSAGTLTFQYGTSPIACYFAQEGVWSITFGNSWNMIKGLTYVSSLPTNLIYFGVPSVPEFPSTMILPLFFLTMLIATIFLKKKRAPFSGETQQRRRIPFLANKKKRHSRCVFALVGSTLTQEKNVAQDLIASSHPFDCARKKGD